MIKIYPIPNTVPEASWCLEIDFGKDELLPQIKYFQFLDEAIQAIDKWASEVIYNSLK